MGVQGVTIHANSAHATIVAKSVNVDMPASKIHTGLRFFHYQIQYTIAFLKIEPLGPEFCRRHAWKLHSDLRDFPRK
jgi:hypothetical protein